MKVWLTFPFADIGIEEREAEEGSGGHTLRLAAVRGLQATSYGYPEHVYWHRTKEAAVAQAERNRGARIAQAAKELARLTKFPPIAA